MALSRPRLGQEPGSGAGNGCVQVQAEEISRAQADKAPDDYIRRENVSALAVMVVLAAAALFGIISAIITYIILGAVVVFYWVIIAFEREGIAARRRS